MNAPQPSALPRQRNWRRGFFRLWIVASFLWIGSIALIFSPWSSVSIIAEASQPTPIPDMVRIKQNVLRMANASSSEADIDAYIEGENVTVEAIREFELAPWDHYAATGGVQTKEQAAALKRAGIARSKSDLIAFALVSLIPVGAAFLLGVAVDWVGRGFRGAGSNLNP